MARSGIAAAKRSTAIGARVLVTEIKPTSDAAQELKDLGIEVELGGHSARSIETDLIVVSPGIHLDIPILEEAKKKGVPIISEIELAYQILKKPIIAVTGTNGKTTTTTLIGEMLKAGGKKVAVAGNIGNPLVAVDDRKLDYVVAEISSYQLESIKDFKPWISLILNIQEDHIERHGSMEEYINQKARIFMNQSGDDYVVYNQDDPHVLEMVKVARAELIGFSKNHPEIITIHPDSIKIPGKHNLENALAAVEAAYLCGIGKDTVSEVLRTFPGVEHRIEPVKTINGIEFYNDSKATNPDSTLVALDTFVDRKVILILGGKDKGVALDALCEKVKQTAKAVVLVGEATKRLKSALENSGYINIIVVRSMGNAVRRSFKLAKNGDVVLLSPACASFDMFTDFEERGRVFKDIVHAIKV
jgi:UDP-N-acetylmuramoylalanine--D-glutamate ligase